MGIIICVAVGCPRSSLILQWYIIMENPRLCGVYYNRATWTPPPLPLPLPIACHPFDPVWPVHDLSPFNTQCPSCAALHWLDKHLAMSSRRNPTFGMCCYSGKVSLPPLHAIPPELYHLLADHTDPRGTAFQDNIHNYNNMLAMTSVGRQLDHTLNNGGGPWVFKLHGQLTHRIGSLLPQPIFAPSHAQLYIQLLKKLSQCLAVLERLS